MSKGKLYLIPVPLGDASIDSILPQAVQDCAKNLSHFVAENAKTARAFLKTIETTHPIQSIKIEELNKQTADHLLSNLLAPLLEGIDVGLISEAGCPAIADPGAKLVDLAHQHEIQVIPMVGPSSILLALMASGLSGQNFAFHGYLPVKSEMRHKKIQELERDSRKEQRAQIFIETPYRNQQMLLSLIASCSPTTRICVASNLTCENERILTMNAKAWKTKNLPDLDKQPTVFIIQA